MENGLHLLVEGLLIKPDDFDQFYYDRERNTDLPLEEWKVENKEYLASRFEDIVYTVDIRGDDLNRMVFTHKEYINEDERYVGFEKIADNSQKSILENLNIEYRELHDVVCSDGDFHNVKLLVNKGELTLITPDGIINLKDDFIKNPDRYEGQVEFYQLDNSVDEVAMFEMQYADNGYNSSALVAKIMFPNERYDSGIFSNHKPVSKVELNKEELDHYKRGSRYLLTNSVKDLDTLLDGQLLELVLENGKPLTHNELLNKQFEDLPKEIDNRELAERIEKGQTRFNDYRIKLSGICPIRSYKDMSFVNADFSGAGLAGEYVNCDFSGANFSHNDLYETVFKDCNCENAIFDNSTIVDLEMENCELEGASFKNTEQWDLVLHSTSLKRAKDISGFDYDFLVANGADVYPVSIDQDNEEYQLLELVLADAGLPENDYTLVKLGASYAVFDKNKEHIKSNIEDNASGISLKKLVYQEAKKQIDENHAKKLKEIGVKFKNIKGNEGLIITTFALTTDPSKKFEIILDPKNPNNPTIKGKAFNEMATYIGIGKDKLERRKHVRDVLNNFSTDFFAENKTEIEAKKRGLTSKVKPEIEEVKQKQRSKNRLTR